MAKLSARGRVELLRVKKSLPDKSDEFGTLTQRSLTRAYMSDGKVLEKYQVRFPAENYRGSYLHDWGWNVRGTYSKPIETVRKAYIENGWEVIA